MFGSYKVSFLYHPRPSTAIPVPPHQPLFINRHPDSTTPITVLPQPFQSLHTNHWPSTAIPVPPHQSVSLNSHPSSSTPINGPPQSSQSFHTNHFPHNHARPSITLTGPGSPPQHSLAQVALHSHDRSPTPITGFPQPNPGRLHQSQAFHNHPGPSHHSLALYIHPMLSTRTPGHP